MTDTPAADQWAENRTTFQRVYETVLGTTEYVSVGTVAQRATCSETAARGALEQLVEMGIAERRDSRPAVYRRNGSYTTWRRVESLAEEHDTETLRVRLADLVDEEQSLRDQFDAPEPDAVSTANLPVGDHEAVERRWEALSEWRTVRRDIRVLRRAVERAGATDDGTATA